MRQVIVITVIYAFIITVLVFCVGAFPFTFTIDPNQHMRQYFPNYSKVDIVSKQQTFSKAIEYSWNNNEIYIRVEYKKFLRWYYLSTFSYRSNSLRVLNMGIMRTREEKQ